MNNIGLNIDGFLPMDKDVTGWNYSSDIFKELIDKVNPQIIIEVGTWKGASAINMAKLSKAHTIYCVDTWLGAEEFYTTHSHTQERDLMLQYGYPQIYYQFLSNIIHEGVSERIVPIANTSDIGFKIFKHKGIKADLIYIDGSHEYHNVKRDIENYIQLLNPGGIIFGDDFGWSDVSNAVKDTLKDFNVIEDNYWIKQI